MEKTLNPDAAFIPTARTALRTSDAGPHEAADRDSIGKSIGESSRGMRPTLLDELDRLGFDDVRNRSDRAHLNPVGQFCASAWCMGPCNTTCSSPRCRDQYG